MAAVTLLETRGLERHFGGLRAVAGVDMTVTAGEIRALIGPNGAGKTTLVDLIAGRRPPSAGRVLFDGRDITALPAFRRVQLGIAYTFQITSIYPRLAVAENVALAAASAARRSSRTRSPARGIATADAVTAALDRVGLADRRHEPAGTLAYGHQRLLELAMGLALDPRLLILDEPTQGLSDQEIDGFVEIVRSIADHATVLLIEHNMDVVMRLADRITVLDQGRVLAEGAPAEIRANAQVQAAYLGAGG